MLDRDSIIDLYSQNPIPNPINFTFTFKQRVASQAIDVYAANQNVRHFTNLLNRSVFGNAHKRFNKHLSIFVVHEFDHFTRYHVHGIIEQPSRYTTEQFLQLVADKWQQTRFGYSEIHFKKPQTPILKDKWLKYCLKKRTKTDLLSSIDWENTTCFSAAE